MTHVTRMKTATIHLAVIIVSVTFTYLFPLCVYMCVAPDIDECEMGEHLCSIDAICTNTNGGYMCECQPGYTGDGKNCTGQDISNI